MKLKIPSDISWGVEEKVHSHRSGRSQDGDGIKSARHKFGTRQRNKTQKVI